MGALTGYRVLDFSEGIPGPLATALLADHGAEVIKVEGPQGDRMDEHPGYLAWNRNKQRIRLDVRSPDGLAAALRLLETADVAVFDSSPGELERLGFDATALQARNPALLHVWLPMFGTDGPWTDLPHDDGLLAALTGQSFLQFSYEDVPVWLVTPVVSYHYALGAAVAIAASLFERLQSGRGQSLVMTGLDALAISQSGSVIDAPDMVRMGSSIPGARGGTANYRLYRCADGEWLFLGTLTPKFFLRALDLLDLLDLLSREDVAGEVLNLFRGPAALAAVEALDRKFAEKPRAEWLRILEEADLPRAPVGVREDWFRGEVVEANEMCVSLTHPRLGPVLIPGVPAKLQGTPGEVQSLLADTSVAALAPHAPVLRAGRSPSRQQPSESGGPLTGVRVLDFGGYIAGTFGPTVLAAFGADVIKIEGLEGDPFRFAALSAIGHNQGKRSLAIDLKAPLVRETIHDLVRHADLVLDNFRKGVPERLGIDYGTLRGVKPDIITCSVTGYGWGPMADRPGFDPLVQAESGMMKAQGGEREPVFYQLPVNDESTAIMNAFGMVLALIARERSGVGQKVETALANQSVLLQSGELTWFEGRPPAPVGDMDCRGTGAFRRLYRCADGWIAVACTTADEAAGLCEALGHPEWLDGIPYSSVLDQSVASPVAEAAGSELIVRKLNDALATLLTAGVPAAPAYRIEELRAGGWLGREGFEMETVYPLVGPLTSVRGYATWSRTAAGFDRGCPMVGQHSIEVLRESKIPEDRIDRLVAEGSVAQWEPGG